jgi:hypothetical protein
MYQRHNLEAAAIERLDFVAPSVCEITIGMTVNGSAATVTTRWLHLKDDSDDPVVEPDAGTWRLVLWGPEAFLTG